MTLKTQKFLVKFTTNAGKLMEATFNLNKDVTFYSEDNLLSMLGIPDGVKIVSAKKI